MCLDLRPSVHQSVAKNIEARVGVFVKDKRFPDCDFAELTSNFKAPRFPSLIAKTNGCLIYLISLSDVFHIIIKVIFKIELKLQG